LTTIERVWYNYLSILQNNKKSIPGFCCVTDDQIKSYHNVNKGAIITIFCMLGIIFWPGSNFASAEKQDVKTKKPRFEVSKGNLVDNKTRLMWLLDGDHAEQTVSWNGAFEYIDNLNRAVFGGHKDWRLPSREELEALVGQVKEQGFGSDGGGTVAAGLHALGMKTIKDVEYWTSTEHIYNAGEAWFVNMRNGVAGTGMKTLYFSLLPVRSLE